MIIQSSIGISEILSIASNILAPLIGALAAVVVWLHRRITRLEQQQKTQQQSLYGSESDALNQGVIEEVRDMKLDIEQVKLAVEEIRDKFDD